MYNQISLREKYSLNIWIIYSETVILRSEILQRVNKRYWKMYPPPGHNLL